MNDWDYVSLVPGEKLARLHYFTMQKPSPCGPVDVKITIWEYATPEMNSMRFFAQTDVELNQKVAPFRPCGWSDTLMGALSECLRNIRKFEYQAEAAVQI